MSAQCKVTKKPPQVKPGQQTYCGCDVCVKAYSKEWKK